MKYRTTIQITTEAADKNEALEIVGDYLSGNLVSGIEMKCRTAPAANCKRRIVAVGALSLMIVCGVILQANLKSSTGAVSASSGMSAIQPPLKTSRPDDKASDFKTDWQNRQTNKALEYIQR